MSLHPQGATGPPLYVPDAGDNEAGGVVGLLQAVSLLQYNVKIILVHVVHDDSGPVLEFVLFAKRVNPRIGLILDGAWKGLRLATGVAPASG